MKKTTRLLSNMRRGVLIAITPLILVASCASRKADNDHNSVEQQIISLGTEVKTARTEYQKMTADSIARNPNIKTLSERMEVLSPRIDSLIMRNRDIRDSVYTKQLQKIAVKYPLTKFMTQQDINRLRNMLKESHSSWNEQAAQNIIAGRGTLEDLYQVCFDLDYSNNLPFYIFSRAGSVRFIDESLNTKCEEYDQKVEQLDNRMMMQEYPEPLMKNKEFQNNAGEIDAYNAMCDTMDSLRTDIHNHFLADYADKYAHKEELIRKLYSKYRQQIRN